MQASLKVAPEICKVFFPLLVHTFLVEALQSQPICYQVSYELHR